MAKLISTPELGLKTIPAEKMILKSALECCAAAALSDPTLRGRLEIEARQ